MIQPRPSSRFLSSLISLFLLALWSSSSDSRCLVPTVRADDVNTSTTPIQSMHRDATDTITNEAAPEQRRELFWSLTFLSKCFVIYSVFLSFICSSPTKLMRC